MKQYCLERIKSPLFGPSHTLINYAGEGISACRPLTVSPALMAVGMTHPGVLCHEYLVTQE